MEINVMIEAQAGVYWPEWQQIVTRVEELGFDGLYRSDHFPHGSPPTQPALELWTSLTWLASHTERITFGPLVTPAGFRHPAITAWSALQVNDLSKGRLRLGLGAGWHEDEHQTFGFDLLEFMPRFARFEEYLQVVIGLLKGEGPLDFDGEHYRLEGAMLTPQPGPDRAPPITIGGNGRQLTLPLVAKYADEWNCFWRSHEQLASLNTRLDELLEAEGREPGDVRRTMMTGIFYGRDDRELSTIVGGQSRSAEELQTSGAIVGTGAAVRDQIDELAELGLDGVMLQWLDVRGLDRLEAMAREIL